MQDATQAQAWHDSDVRARIHAHLGGVPDLLAVHLPTDGGIHAHHEHWHCVVYGALVLRRHGTTYGPGEVYGALTAAGLTWGPGSAEAVLGFLAHLRSAGHLDYNLDAAGRPDGPVRVLRDVHDDRADDAANRTSPPTASSHASSHDTSEANGSTPATSPRAPAPATHRDQARPRPVNETGGTRPACTAPAARVPTTPAQQAWVDASSAALAGLGVTPAGVTAVLAVAAWGADVTIDQQ